MINSRDIKDLHPIVQKMTINFIAECKKEGINLLITSTYRDNESQDSLYAQGRTKDGLKVTNAKGGQSFHNYRVAIDVVPLENGKPNWNSKKWSEIGRIGEKHGFFWGKRWTSFSEMPHFQYTGKVNNYSYALKHFQKGGSLEQLIEGLYLK